MEAIKILEYEPKLQPAFEKLNREWIEKYFVMEPVDIEVVTKPEEHIINHGGTILFVSYNDQIAGTVALKKESTDLYELCKMAVDENFRGHRIGLILGEAALKKAKELGAKKVILYSQTTFNNGIAINLYNRLGFKEVELEKGGYERCNIKMLFDFAVHDYLKQMAEWLRKLVAENYSLLKLIPEAEWNRKDSLAKWSKKEIIGHLLDSASNNHQRFVRAQFTDELIFPRYQQNEWVKSQNHHHQQSQLLIDLWLQYNNQLAWIIENIHHDKLNTVCKIGDNQPVPLKYLVEDYIYHMVHHLKQVIPDMDFVDTGMAEFQSDYRIKLIGKKESKKGAMI